MRLNEGIGRLSSWNMACIYVTKYTATVVQRYVMQGNWRLTYCVLEDYHGNTMALRMNVCKCKRCTITRTPLCFYNHMNMYAYNHMNMYAYNHMNMYSDMHITTILAYKWYVGSVYMILCIYNTCHCVAMSHNTWPISHVAYL